MHLLFSSIEDSMSIIPMVFQDGYNLIIEARRFAITAHGDQIYGEQPYEYHLNMVGEVLTEFGFTKELTPHYHAAAWLHDTVEDTDASLHDLTVFSSGVTLLVDYMTQQGDDSLATYYHRMLSWPQVVILKLADNIANARMCRFDISCGGERAERGNRLLQKYRDAIPHRLPLRSYGPEVMWAHFDWLLREST